MAPKKGRAIKRGGVFIGLPPPPHATETATRLDQLAIEHSRKPGEPHVDDNIMDTVNVDDPCTYVSFARGNSFGLLTNGSLMKIGKMAVPNLDPFTMQPLDPLVIQRAQQTATRTYPLPQGSIATCATFSPDNKFVIAGTLEGGVHVWKTKSDRALQLKNPEDLSEHANTSVRKVWCQARLPNTVFVGRVNGVLEEWQISEFRFVRVLNQYVSPSMFAFDFSHDANYAVGENFGVETDTRGLMEVCDVVRGLQHTVRGHDGMMFDAKYSLDGAYIATTGHDRAVKLWEARTQQLIHHFEGRRRIGHSVMFSPNGTQLAMGCADGAVYLWNLEPRYLMHTLRDNRRPKTAKSILAFSPNGRILVVGSNQSILVEFWKTSTGHFAGVCTLAPGASPRHIFVSQDEVHDDIYFMTIICNHGFVHFYKFR